MSVKVMSWAWHDERTRSLKGNAMLALLALADVADDDGNVIYLANDARSQNALAAKARMSVATFRRATQALAENGLLDISRESRRVENAYRVVVTAQSERSQMSDHSAQVERSERSRVSGHSSIGRSHGSTRGESTRGTRIPDPFVVTAKMREWAAEEVPGLDVDTTTRNFVAYWRTKPGKAALKIEWERVWENWLQKDFERMPATRKSNAMAAALMAAQLEAEEMSRELGQISA